MSNINSIFTQQYSLFFNTNRKTQILSVAFAIFLLVFELSSLQTGYLQFFDYLQDNRNYVFSIVCILHILVTLYLTFIFFLLAFNSKWYCAFIYFSIFTFSTFCEYGYQKALDKFTDVGDVVIALSATNEQKLDSIFTFLNFSALVPCIIFIILSLFVKTSARRFGFKPLLCVFILYCCFYSYYSFINVAFVDHKFPNISFGAFWQTTTDFALNRAFFNVNPPVRDLVKTPELPKNYVPNNNIIVVFDETVRADHLSVNGYSRSTTPYLEELASRGLLKNYGVAVSASTSSHPSYEAFITGVTFNYSNETWSNNYMRPTIFQYAKAMNYKTYLFDGQMKKYWGSMPDDLNFINHFISLKDLDERFIEDWEIGDTISHQIIDDGRLQSWEVDSKIAKMVNQIFASSTGNFIFIYKRGNHFPYEKNYPPSAAFWKPIYLFNKQYEVPSAEKYEGIVNSYDNSVKYNIDNFFKNLSNNYSKLPNNTVIIYTGDHGESFYANQKAAHGGITREEAMVPLFLIGDLRANLDTNYKASHCNIFPTLLDLMNYPENMRKPKYALSLFTATSKDSTQRFFNRPFGERIPFE